MGKPGWTVVQLSFGPIPECIQPAMEALSWFRQPCPFTEPTSLGRGLAAPSIIQPTVAMLRPAFGSTKHYPLLCLLRLSFLMLSCFKVKINLELKFSVSFKIRALSLCWVCVLSQAFVSGFGKTSAGDASKVVSGFPSIRVGNGSAPLGYLAFNGLFAGWYNMETGRSEANGHLGNNFFARLFCWLTS